MTNVPNEAHEMRSGEAWMATPDHSPLGHDMYPQPITHITIKAAPIQRQVPYKVNRWPHGVVLGGIILDMIEYLRTDSKANATDQDLSLWLEDNYIRPFKSIERMEGLVVRDGLDMATLTYAHVRYTVIFPMPEGSGLPPQRLWVPGLEPMYAPQEQEHQHVIKFSTVTAPHGGFEDYEMYKGIKERAGVNLGAYKDPVNGWMRQLRETPAPSPLDKRVVVQEVGVKMRALEKQPIPLPGCNRDNSELKTCLKAMLSNIIDATGNQHVENKLTYSQSNMLANFNHEHDQTASSSAFGNAGPDGVDLAGADTLVLRPQDSAPTVNAHDGASTLAGQNPTGTIQGQANVDSESEHNEPWTSSTSDGTSTYEAPTPSPTPHEGINIAQDWEELLPAIPSSSSEASDASVIHDDDDDDDDDDDETKDVATRSGSDEQDSEWSASMDLGEED